MYVLPRLKVQRRRYLRSRLALRTGELVFAQDGQTGRHLALDMARKKIRVGDIPRYKVQKIDTLGNADTSRSIDVQDFSALCTMQLGLARL